MSRAAAMRLLSLLLLWAPLAASAQEAPRDLTLVLLIGQSNMAGRGTIEQQDKVPIPGVFMLDAADRWVPAVDPVHGDKPTAGVGPAREFARALIKARPGARIGLVPAAVGGTSLERWRPGGELYRQALARLRVAQRSGTLAVILWHQGEADASSAEASAGYARNWAAMMAQLRTDAGARGVPIIAGELGSFLRRPYAPIVNAQIRSLPHVLDQVAVASAAGLTDRGDRLHFDAASQRELGRRYAAAFFGDRPAPP